MRITSLRQYQIESRKTAIYPDLGQNLWYPSLGLMEELEELNDAQRAYGLNYAPELLGSVIAEAGDVAWYIAQICTELDLDLGVVVSLCRPEGSNLGWHRHWSKASGLTDISYGFIAKTAKKWHRDGGTPDRLQHFVFICQYFWYKSVDHNVNFSTEYPDVWAILSANIAKLNDRMERNTIKGDGDNR
jgi:NTP pyrophosphatase (non-canonical NTP hydrolase)